MSFEQQTLFCQCTNCDRDLYEGEEVFGLEGELFCCVYCVLEYLNVDSVTVGEE